jgi:hypothetical protein
MINCSVASRRVNHPFRVFKLTNGPGFTESRSTADNLSHVRIVL